MFLLVVLIGIPAWGITEIRVNDNYAKRFTKSHPIRKADAAFNKHPDGTYAACLILQGKKPGDTTARDIKKLGEQMAAFAHDIKGDFTRAPDLAGSIRNNFKRLNEDDLPYEDYLDALMRHIKALGETAPDDDHDALQEIRAFIGIQKERRKVFKRPEVPAYITALQKHLKDSELVGKTTSIADVVCKVNQELIGGKGKLEIDHLSHVRGTGPGHQPKRAGHRHRIPAAPGGALDSLQNHGPHAVCHHESFRRYYPAGPAVHTDPL